MCGESKKYTRIYCSDGNQNVNFHLGGGYSHWVKKYAVLEKFVLLGPIQKVKAQ